MTYYINGWFVYLIKMRVSVLRPSYFVLVFLFKVAYLLKFLKLFQILANIICYRWVEVSPLIQSQTGSFIKLKMLQSYK